MAERRENFTNTFISSLPPADVGKRYVIYDVKEQRLGVRVTDKGAKSFILFMKVNGRVLRVTLGKYPDMKVLEAREALITNLKMIQHDEKNPNDEKKKFRQESALKDLFETYMERYSKKTKRSWIYDQREIPKFLSHWFNRRISDISKIQIQKLHERVNEENGLYQANRLLERLRSMYNRAIEWGWEGTNPTNGIKKYKEVKRDRFLLPKEFPLFFKALDEEENAAARNYIWMSLLTGARKGNVLSMRWDEIDFNRANWHIPKTKNGEPLDVPLVEKAIELLKSIPEDCEWVFPNPASKSGHLEDPKKAWARILTKAGIKNLRLHDIRRTLGSYQAITGSSLLVIGKSLGHKSTAATQVYARLHDDPVRQSMENAIGKMLEFKENDE